ncbi:MAG: PAS domain S-box protein [Thermoflexales bacterium]|nr:PAS domain S-box protein [Thermoflexales bacterium]
MRTTHWLYLLAFLLSVTITAITGYLNAVAPGWNGWLLSGVMIAMCVGLVMTGGQIRLIHLKERGAAVEEELSIAEARFQAFFNDPAVGIGILGLDRRLVDANPTFFRIFGRTRAEMIGLNAAEVTYPDDDPVSAKLFAELMAGQRDSYESDRRYLRKNGEVFWAHVTMSVVRGSDRQPRYLVGMVLDVDKQKRIALALQESEERFRAAFESSAIGMALMTLEGRFLKANAAIRAMSGYTEEELTHLTSDNTVFPDDALVGLDLFIEILAGQRDYYQVERRYVRKNGEVFWTRLTLSAVREVSGAAAYVVALVEDIDDQKRMLTDLRKSEARFQAVFENAAVGITLNALDGQVLAINPVTTQIVQYTADELRALNPLDLIVPEADGSDAELYRELINGQRNSYAVELQFRRKDGMICWARVNYSLVRGPDGQPDYVITLIEDIDDEKRATARLAAQEAEYRRSLEERITERTAELNQANQLLQQQAAQEAVNSERTRLARDLHDAVTQTLFSASLIAEVMPELWDLNPAEARRRLEELRQLTRGALAEMRTLLVELRPNALVDVPLPDLLRQLTDSFIGRARLPVQLTVEGQRTLPADVQLALYRITQEALNNIVKHAGATQVLVTLLFSVSDAVRLSIVDNGAGFDPVTVLPDHLGTQIMRERAAAIGASYALYSAPGEGTQITITWAEPGAKDNLDD